ncbi:28S ribosomal protein S28, mitochondrial-like [Argiope bruennichi]|uniref:28S ribosomal protein S28, mitochondrial-like n=1 Tax=Argiope bruennichi TaxID=94029 RepID=UPI0024950477|nr:28S ribosomal protein S28, mitochondrial-like [Argiope bruennichi]
MLRLIRNLNLLRAVNSANVYNVQVRCSSDSRKDNETDHPDKKNEISISGLAQALGKFRELEKSEGKVESPPKPQRSFLNLLRHSEFVQMGDPHGKVVVGKIFQVVKTDLYIDFGGKFYCVCRKPKKNSELYVRNAEVKLRINELELCARFLGAVEDLTLLEASATLIELVSTPVSSDAASRLRKNN